MIESGDTSKLDGVIKIEFYEKLEMTQVLNLPSLVKDSDEGSKITEDDSNWCQKPMILFPC